MNSDLERFISTARWFGGKGRPFAVRAVRRVGELPGGESPRVVVDLAEITYQDDAGGTELYQLPLSCYLEAEERLEHAYVGHWDDPALGKVHVYDAVHDRDAMALWLRAFAAEEVSDSPLMFHRLEGHELDIDAQGALFSGEQSNSSVAFGEDSLMKVFRKVTPGVNPDVQVHEVLTRIGSEHVAALYGWLDTVDEKSDSVIQLAMLQQFLRTASDGWDLARASVRNLFAEADLHAEEVGGDFAAETSRLGVAVAETHQALREHFPTDTVDADSLAEGMAARLRDAVGTVPQLAEHQDALGSLFAGVSGLGSVPVQRIHGDLHLGQTLRTVKGWKLVDFEGEPAKPLADRLLPDPVWRDVAGMLRSFDYVGAVVAREMEGDEDIAAQREYRAHEWSARNRAAFVTAYAGQELTEAERLLLDAYELDKAVYECTYEARNRPDWLGIPLAAVARLAGAT